MTIKSNGTNNNRNLAVIYARVSKDDRNNATSSIEGQFQLGRELADEQGYDLEKKLGLDDLVSGDDVFFAATGITDGELLEGVEYRGKGASTYSLVMRSRSGTVREIKSIHSWDKLMRYSQIAYDAGS